MPAVNAAGGQPGIADLLAIMLSGGGGPRAMIPPGVTAPGNIRAFIPTEPRIPGVSSPRAFIPNEAPAPGIADVLRVLLGSPDLAPADAAPLPSGTVSSASEKPGAPRTPRPAAGPAYRTMLPYDPNRMPGATVSGRSLTRPAYAMSAADRWRRFRGSQSGGGTPPPSSPTGPSTQLPGAGPGTQLPGGAGDPRTPLPPKPPKPTTTSPPGPTPGPIDPSGLPDSARRNRRPGVSFF